MWVSRPHYETLVERVTTERSAVAELRARLSAMQATQDWLTTHVNRLEVERSLLTQARLGLTFPVPEISRADLRDQDAGVTRGLPDDAVPLAQLMTASLEDVGDAQAAVMGITHDADGHAQYRP